MQTTRLAVLVLLGCAQAACCAQVVSGQQDDSQKPSSQGGAKGNRAAVLSALSEQPSAPSSLRGQTSLFGITAQGARYVYVFDRSGSMSEYQGRPLAAAKRELLKSLGSLEATQQFQIIFYNEQPKLLNPFRLASPKLLYGNERDKQAAADFVDAIEASGGTEHMESLKAALRMGPDVVFFLTDAAEPPLTDKQLAQIRRWNTSAAAIHAIEFGAGPKPAQESFLSRLARQNRGQYVYVDVTSLTE